MLNVWTRLIGSLSQFSSKISRKSLLLERPWQGLLQLFTLKFWFLNFKKIVSKTERIIRPDIIAVYNWHRSHGNTRAQVSWAKCHVRAVPASKLEWAAEHWAGEAPWTRPGVADTESRGPGSPSSGHGLRQSWGGEVNIPYIPTRPRLECYPRAFFNPTLQSAE